jgi:hypothetical protein
MTMIRENNKLRFALVCVLALAVTAYVWASQTPQAWTVLTPQEAEESRGGVCLFLAVCTVVGAVCGVISVGYIVLEETWDRPDPGSQAGGINTYPTQIRQATIEVEQQCQSIQQFDEVFEGYLDD